jgi:hypothetical protein
MPRKKNPVVAVIEYFRMAPLPAAELVLALAVETVKSRQPLAPKKPKKAGGGAVVQAPIATTRTAPINIGKPAKSKHEEDRPLPGLTSGVVGD